MLLPFVPELLLTESQQSRLSNMPRRFLRVFREHASSGSGVPAFAALVIAMLVGVLAAPVAAHASTADAPAPQATRTLAIPLVEPAPKLEDFLDMGPDAAFKGRMAKLDRLVQRRPKDGAPPSQKTEVYLSYDHKNLYAVFVCFDSKPGLIRAHVGRREDVLDDDSVSISLDTFHDRRKSYLFIANPYGIQLDGITSEGQDDDFSFDTLWYSRGQRTASGYVVWMAIPFKSLRFRNSNVQTWGVAVNRDMPRLSEQAFWPYITDRITGYNQQLGTANGLQGISPGRNMQFIPYGLFRNYRAVDPRNPDALVFSHKRAKFDAGLDSKFIIHDSLVLDTTINPDFSQVESDDPQVTINQRFEVFFPEKRPFFLENASYFQTPIQLFFTRRIIRPTAGARLTGRLGKYTLGMMVSDDRGPGRFVPTTDTSADQRAYFAIARVARDFADQSSVGVMFADREFHGAFNRVGGVDFRYKINSHWVASGQAVESSTRCDYYTDFCTPGAYLAGPAFEFDLNRQSRGLTYNLHYQGRSTGFRTQTGFDPQPDINWVNTRIEYAFRPEGKHLLNWGPHFEAYRNYDHDGVVLNWGYTPLMFANLTRQTHVEAGYAEEAETLRPIDFPILTRNVEYVRNTKFANIESSITRQLHFKVDYRFGRRINYDSRLDQAPYLATRHQLATTLTVRPTNRLQVDNTYLWFRLKDTDSGHAAFNNHIIRSKWNYQFTREFSFRFIGQYNAILANPGLTWLPNAKQFNADALFTYLVHPGTAIYVGYNSDLQNLYPDLRVDENLTPLRRRDRFINDGHVLFVKVSYLFRF